MCGIFRGKKTFVAAMCVLFVLSSLRLAPAAPPPDGELIFDDGGQMRSFELALDELYVIEAGGRPAFQTIPPRHDRADLFAAIHTLSTSISGEAGPILYLAGAERTPYSRRLVTARLLVRLDTTTNADALLESTALTAYEQVDYAPGYIIFSAPSPTAAFDSLAPLQSDPGVLYAQPLLAKRRQKKWVPNDTLFPQQWHLRNTGQGGGTAGIDVRATNVWAMGYRGSNILVGIVDDGLQYTHPDLSPNYVAAYSRNWNGSPGGTLDPAPNLSYDAHGTACAGVTAARGNNSIGVSGVAPFASLSGLRLISTDVSDSEEAAAMLHSNGHLFVKSNSWGPFDDGQRLEAPGTLTRAALSNSVITGRNGRGTLHIWAGGNGLDANDNANYDGYANSIYTISIAAITDSGAQSWYSEPGACHVVTAPSSGGSTDIVTTDLLGEDGYNYSGASGELADRDYTRTFGGTSSSTPLVAGIVALMIEANPALGWRDVQEVLIRSARQINPLDIGWRTNSAGFTFNHKFGSGLVDAHAAVSTALTWTNLGTHLSLSTNKSSLGLAIPDNNATGISTTFNVQTNIRVEQATLTVDIAHARRGHLEVFLTSPSGMQSQLAEKHTDNNANYTDWTFMTVHNWGEAAQGLWTLKVADRTAGTTGTLNSARLTLYGTSQSVISNQPPQFNPIAAQTALLDEPFSFTVTATDAMDSDTVRLWATDIPAWASFAGATNAASASSLFSGTPNATGLYAVIFHAADKDGTNSMPVDILVRDGSGGLETFENFSAGGSYVDGTFTGQDGSTWTYKQCRGDFSIEGSSPCLGRNRTPDGEVISGTLPGGCGNLSLDWMKAYSTDVNLEVYVNSDLVGTITGGTTDVPMSTNFTVNSSGDFVLRFLQPSGAGQVVIDNVAWTAYASEIPAGYDNWAASYGLDPHGAGGGIHDDFDGDNYSNLQEFIAGTDPTTANSVFNIAESSAPDADKSRLAFAVISNRIYNVWMASNLTVNTSWNLMRSFTNETTGEQEVIITNPAPTQLYRIGVRLP